MHVFEGVDIEAPKPTSPRGLPLNEVLCILAFGDAERAYAELCREESIYLDTYERKLLRALERGEIVATGKYGNHFIPRGELWESDKWAEHSMEPTRILPNAWESRGVDWGRSTLTTRAGEYIEVRLDEGAVRELAIRWERRAAVSILGSQPAMVADDGPSTPTKSSGRKVEFQSEDLLAFMAAVLEDKGEPKSDEEAIEWFQLAYAATYGEGNEPSRSTIQAKVMKPLNAARRARRRARETAEG